MNTLTSRLVVLLALWLVLSTTCNSTKTVFVLETDSSQGTSGDIAVGSVSDMGSEPVTDATRIIIDTQTNKPPSQQHQYITSDSVHKPQQDQPRGLEKRTHDTQANRYNKTLQQSPSGAPATSSSSSTTTTTTTSTPPSPREAKHSDPVGPRRKTDDDNNNPRLPVRSAQPSSTSNQHHQQHQNHHQQPRSRSTTTTTTQQPATTLPSAYIEETAQTPKVEDRLLISILTNEQDDDQQVNRRPPQNDFMNPVGSSSSLNSYTGNSSLSLSLQQQQKKRKPTITISIQNAESKDTNNDGVETPSVIVRPQDGGIVILPVNNANTISNSNHKEPHSHNKPTSQMLGGTGDSPYREPINNPGQSSGIAGIYNPTASPLYENSYTSSSRRPHIHVTSDSNPIRPPSSTLLEPVNSGPHRPSHISGSSSINDERPQRPTSTTGSGYQDELGSDGLSGPMITSRPPHFNNRPITTSPRPNSPYESNDETYPVSGPNGGGGARPTSGQSSESSNEQPKYPLNEENCGRLHETRIVGGDEANPDDFMWMAAIIKANPKDGEARPFCGGSLITRRHILTAAHCLENRAPRDVLVRLGSYDFDDATASATSGDYAIDQFRVPGAYSKKSHAADIAIMRLKTPLSPNDNYKTVCMPLPRRSYVGVSATVTGYGSQSQSFRRAAPKLRQVTVPIWENRKCSVVYKKNMTESFLCAGYEEGGKDACQGDSGGPLMTMGPNDRMMIVGIVSHGIGCGAPGYPGVYTRTTAFLDWIKNNTRE